MTLALWILLAAFFLPFVAAGVAKWGRRDYDNAQPRAWEAQLDGKRARAIAAMNNSFEALPFFATAVLVAHHLQAPQAWVDGLSGLWLLLRVLYLFLYVTNRASARSLVWLGGIVINVWLFVLAA